MRRYLLNLIICHGAFILGTIAAIGFVSPETPTIHAPAEKRETQSDASKPVLTETADRSRESRYPMIEIWKKRDGSVTVRGESLHFRLYNDGAVEFDYELRKENESGKPRYTFYFERTPPAKISDEEFSSFKSLLDDLIKSKNIKHEYQTVALTFDVIEELTVLLKENDGSERKIIINDSDIDVMAKAFEKRFPNTLINLIKEVHSMKIKLQEKKKEQEKS